MQLSSFVLFLLQCFFYPVRNSSGWLCACSSCTSLLSQDPRGFVLPQHSQSTKRGQTAGKRNLPRDKADICCLHKEVLELSGNSRQLCTGRGGTPGNALWVTCGNSEWGQPREMWFCGTVPVSLKPWLRCDTPMADPAAASHPYGTLGPSAPGH